MRGADVNILNDIIRFLDNPPAVAVIALLVVLAAVAILIAGRRKLTKPHSWRKGGEAGRVGSRDASLTIHDALLRFWFRRPLPRLHAAVARLGAFVVPAERAALVLAERDVFRDRVAANRDDSAASMSPRMVDVMKVLMYFGDLAVTVGRSPPSTMR